MKTSMKHILSCALVLGMATTAAAQNFQSGYFLDNFAYSYRLNPSLMIEKSFLGLGIGNINTSIQSDLGLSSVLFPTEDGLVTGLNSKVSADQFLGGLQDDNALALGANVNIFALGIRGDNHMKTFEVNLRTTAEAAVPKDLFAFLKQGSKTDAYDLSGLHAGANALVEAAFGSGRNISGKLTIGYRIKVLAGAGADLNLEQAQIIANGGNLAMNASGELKLAAGPVSIGQDADGNLDFNNIGFSTQKLMSKFSYGGAVDLGVSWEPLRGLRVSAGINDLGLVSWNYNLTAGAAGGVSFKGIDELSEDGIQATMDDITAQFNDLCKFHISGDALSVAQMLPFTANVAAKYRLPFFRRMSVGALYTYHNDAFAGWYDLRAGATITPLNWFSLSANYGKNTFGNVCGAALSLTLLGINVFAGVDAYSGSITMIPTDTKLPMGLTGIPAPIGPFRYNINFGITLQMFGQRRSDILGNYYHIEPEA